MSLDLKNDVCFVGLGASPLCYYRIMLPAMALGCDWCGVTAHPPKLEWRTGLVKNRDRNKPGSHDSQMPDLSRYKVVVVQQPYGQGWLDAIKALQEQGTKVVFEVDDYLHGIKFQEDHDFKSSYTNSFLSEIEKTLKACDAVLCSTEVIKTHYRNFNKRIHLCRNGIDIRRYELDRPEHNTVNIGWAGATGHLKAVEPWFQQTAQIMLLRENTCFISIGQGFAEGFAKHFGRERAISVPWAAIEQYPAAMTMFDIALAPSGQGEWWAGKSDLRWLEAGALGIPIIAHPRNYPEIEDGVTGFHATNPMEVAEILLRLVDDADLRTTVGTSARKHVREARDFRVMAKQWADALTEVVDGADAGGA